MISKQSLLKYCCVSSSEHSIRYKDSAVLSAMSAIFVCFASTGKIGKFPNWNFVWILYGVCVETEYFPNMEIVQVFQTWISSEYQFGFSRYQTWISEICARTSYLEINKTSCGFYGNRSTYWDFPFPKHGFSFPIPGF